MVCTGLVALFQCICSACSGTGKGAEEISPNHQGVEAHSILGD